MQRCPDTTFCYIEYLSIELINGGWSQPCKNNNLKLMSLFNEYICICLLLTLSLHL